MQIYIHLALFSAMWGGNDVGGGGGWREEDFGGPLLLESLSLLSSDFLPGSRKRCEGTPLGESLNTSDCGLVLCCGLWNCRFSWLASVTYFSLCLRRRKAGVHPVKFSSSAELAEVKGDMIGLASDNAMRRQCAGASICAVNGLPLTAKICER